MGRCHRGRHTAPCEKLDKLGNPVFVRDERLRGQVPCPQVVYPRADERLKVPGYDLGKQPISTELTQPIIR
jgi:hypothetical protein